MVITRFECQSYYALVLVRILHHRIGRDVHRYAKGYLGGTTLIRWRQRLLLNFSMWDDLGSIYDMGQVTRHVSASRVPYRLGVATSCGIYTYRGDWRNVMFATPTPAAEEPIHPIQPVQKTDGSPLVCRPPAK